MVRNVPKAVIAEKMGHEELPIIDLRIASSLRSPVRK